jgi:hypothetical protein
LRYCARPPFALQRLEAIDAHRLMYHLSKAQPNGHTEVMLTPVGPENSSVKRTRGSGRVGVASTTVKVAGGEHLAGAKRGGWE